MNVLLELGEQYNGKKKIRMASMIEKLGKGVLT